MLQYIVVGILVVASAIYLCWRAWQALTGRGDPCAGCTGCALSEAKRRKARQQGKCAERTPTTASDKKKDEKFGDNE